MVSHIGLIYRNETADTRIDDAIAAIATARGIDLPERPARTRDAAHNDTLRREWTADVLDAILAAQAEKPAPKRSTAKKASAS